MYKNMFAEMYCEHIFKKPMAKQQLRYAIAIMNVIGYITLLVNKKNSTTKDNCNEKQKDTR